MKKLTCAKIFWFLTLNQCESYLSIFKLLTAEAYEAYSTFIKILFEKLDSQTYHP
jgi:hypothetical protein